MPAKDKEAQTAPIRLDKWLWAARFFKTRSLAIEAVNGGKVHVDGERAKPSKKVAVGMKLEITIGHSHRTMIVLALSDRRGPASIAQALYEETAESLKKRQEAAEQHKLGVHPPRSDRRPDKRWRRQIRQFKTGQ